MMKGTASLQVVIDYQHQADFIEKFRVAHFLMPFLALISDNAPFFEGKPAEHFSIRTAIWDETDPARCALIPGVMDQEFGYRAYADYILRTPPILVQKNNHFIGTGSLRTEELEGLEHFTDEEVDHLLSMVFPDVRVRRYIEIRMADSLPLPHSFAFAALVKNLFYSETALRYLYHLSQSMSDANLCQLRKDMQVNGYNARFGGTTCQQMLLALMDLAKQNSTPQEKKWLYHLEAQVLNKETPAMVSRRLVDAAGMNALEWCAAHTWKKEEI
jgi:glutamate--cysteine ligase